MMEQLIWQCASSHNTALRRRVVSFRMRGLKERKRFFSCNKDTKKYEVEISGGATPPRLIMIILQ